MTNLTEAEARDENIYPILEKPQTVYKDELLEWEDLGERGLIKRLESIFTVRFKFWGLEDDQLSTIRGTIHPESTVRVEPALATSTTKKAIKPDATIIKILDYKQEQLARSLGSGHRLFSGVAGSGKTLILLSRAKVLASGVFNQRVVILCFNITLAAYLRSLIEQENNSLYIERITVLHFHEWAKSIMGGLPNPRNYENEDDYDEVVGDRLLAELEKTPTQEKWDAVLVDEGHTFQPNWFKCCAAALKDTENGDLLIVSDKSQSLYKRRKFTWKSLGIKAQGRVRKLNRNYRNTEEILSAAWNLVKFLPVVEEDEDEAFPLVEPTSALRHGKQPTLHICDNRLIEAKEAIAKIQKLVSEGYQPQHIAIIYRYLGRCEAEAFSHLTQQLEELNLGCYWVNQDKKNYSNNHPGIRLITTKSALGLEFKAVIILWVQQFGVGDEAEAKRELYVSMTRAQDILHLVGSGQFSVLEELEKSNFFECVNGENLNYQYYA
ncbi:MAG: DNA helicase II [Microcoleaceae cyanobacterium]